MTHIKPLRILWLLALFVAGLVNSVAAQLQILNPSYSVGTSTGKVNFSVNQTPDPLVEINPPGILLTSFSYQWESSSTPIFPPSPTVIGTGSSYTFPGSLTQTMYYRRKATSTQLPALSAYSNIVKISVVSVNWEDLNYVRQHNVLTTGISAYQAVDQLPIGQKRQMTQYMDGLGRSLQKVEREASAPASGTGTWSDMVQFSQYDAHGRENQHFLPYVTTTESGKFKSAPQTEQQAYYSTAYNETSAFNAIDFDASPLQRVEGVREAGAKWNISSGKRVVYDMNTTADNVQIWKTDYVQGDIPVRTGAYSASTLFKDVFTNEEGVLTIEYTDKKGQLILKKEQVDNIPTAAHAGWSCTYYVYDDYGQLRFQIQPEGVKYLDANSWSFAGTNGQAVLQEQIFQYNYDDRRLTTWKKSPGANPINFLYDIRRRVVFTQDGNQAALATPQWTTNLYDELDRTVETLLYNTTASISSLQTDINNAATISTVTVPAHSGASQADLSFDHRDPSIARYVASNSITFLSDAGGNFQTADGDVFVAEIDPLPSSPGYSGTVVTIGSPISSANLANSAVTTPVQYLFYDNYAFSNVKSFDNNFTNTAAYSTSDPNVLPIAPSQRATGLMTGSLTRILGSNTFLAETQYYDEKGHVVQTLADNVKSGTDIHTTQYHFDGRVLSNCSSHTAPGTGYTGFITLSKYNFDKLGRPTSTQKQFGSNAFKTVASYEYDDLSRIKTKHLDPEYNNPNLGRADLESLNYSFNIHGQLTGINKDYALKAPATYDKWGHFFGMYFGYDNSDNVFDKARLSGQMTGAMWNSQGDDAQRKYNYTYDNALRLINADYKEQQHPNDGWSNTKMDFSVGGFSGQITYDLNGNLLSMSQKGVIPGSTAPITIDDLRYSYANLSNKLQSVTDQMTTTSVNGLSGDFKDGANSGTPDYVYDNNGNLIVDLNKGVQSLNGGAAGTKGISYNFLDKPEQIQIPGKGLVRIVYSASGTKLQRTFIPDAGGPSVVTSYIGLFTYQETATLTASSPVPFSGTGLALSSINFEEGRIRVITPTNTNNSNLDIVQENGNITLPNSQSGIYDYFVKDNQRNIRMVLTEEVHNVGSTCTMETSRSSTEDPVFGQTGAANEVETTRFPTPAGWQTANTSASVSRLGNIAGHNIGANSLQKVMAGDLVTASALYYFQGSVTSSNPNIVPSVLNSLAAALGGSATSGTLVHGNATPITNQLSNTPGFVSTVQPSNNTSGPPQAYLTVLFFDERFNFISAADGGVYQSQVSSSWTSGATVGIPSAKAPRNGYVYVYVSNRSDQDVYFDNLAVSISAGNIIEEDHYYAFGMKIAALSSKKLGDAGDGSLKNLYLYNYKELNEDGDLEWYDYGYRNYDPQIGRFVAIDPIGDQVADQSTYHYAYNDPINYTDKDGLIGIPCPGTSAFTIFLDKVGEAVTNVLSDISPALQYITIASTVTNTTVHVEQVIQMSNLVNGQVMTISVGALAQSGGNGPGGSDDGGDDNGPAPHVPTIRYYLVFEAITPETYAHIKKATTTGGKPLTLHYNGLYSSKEKDNLRRKNVKVLKRLSDPWRDEYPFACTWENEWLGASVQYAPKNEQLVQRAELLAVTAGLQDMDIIQVVLIPKFSPPPVVVPALRTDHLEDLKRQPQRWTPAPVTSPGWKWNPSPPNVNPALVVGGAAAGITLTYLLETYGAYLLLLAL